MMRLSTIIRDYVFLLTKVLRVLDYFALSRSGTHKVILWAWFLWAWFLDGLVTP
jgi:hypothetical protein